jgi:CRISPR-associated endonuclease Cas1
MAALSTLAHSSHSGKSHISKSGVLVVSGFGLSIRTQNGHLEIDDGVGMDRRKIRLARVGHRLRRVVCVSEDGIVSLSALKWLSEIGVSFVMLDRRGRVRFVTGPTAPTDARLRRAQALAVSNGVGLKICRALIDAKLQNQERLLREQIKDAVTADLIAGFRLRDLPTAETFERLRTVEAHAAVSYFGALRETPVMWPRADAKRTPSHWHIVGSRHSELSGGPRLAVTPFHALLNYCAALLESESRLAVSALGLLPDVGLGLHSDRANRDSLIYDICEPVRPQLESWLLRWVSTEPLQRRDFLETGSGNVRLKSSLCANLGEIAPTLGKLLAPWAEYVAHTLRASHTSQPRAPRGFSTPLTQAHRRNAQSSSPPVLKMPKATRICHGCGTQTRVGRNCPKCGREISRDKLIELVKAGRAAALRPEARMKRSETQRAHEAAKREWRSAQRPIWPDEHTYVRDVQPRLASVTISTISSTLGVCESYAADIRAGRHRPHRRHWSALAQLVGIAEKS